MKVRIVIFIAVLGLGILGLNNHVHADEKGSHKGSMMDGEIAAEVTTSGAVNVGNAICPVSGEFISDVGEGDGVQIEHDLHAHAPHDRIL